MADPVQAEAVATHLQLAGAGSFGAILGWYVYYINRYRRGDLFGAYGVGLAVGFFGYFLTLSGLVRKSRNFNSDWFLDGRRKRPGLDEYIPSDEEAKGLTRGGMSITSDPFKPKVEG